MTTAEYEALVRRLERFANERPALYRLRVGLLAALGYLYLFLVAVALAYAHLLLLCAGALCMVVGLGFLLIPTRGHGARLIVAVGWALLVFARMIVRAVVTSPPPQGRELDRREAPRLFVMIDELRKKLRVGRIHHVQLSPAFNASLTQCPRLGLLGWQVNFLQLGVPLMQALSPEQFRAVVAHELGHFSANHGRFSTWIYRVRRTWGQLLDRLEQEPHFGSFLLLGFFRWYAPYFDASTFALARAEEYVADRSAAQMTDARSAGDALIRIAIKATYLADSFWPELFRRADREPAPPAAVYVTMGRVLKEDPPDAERYLRQELAREAEYDDTHPSLAHRLKALGYLPALADPKTAPVALPPPPAETAAEHYLGDLAEQYLAEVDRVWRSSVESEWRERHAYAQRALAELRALDEKAASQPLTVEEAWERARLTREFRGNDAAIPLLTEVVRLAPDHLHANYALGAILHEQNDLAAIPYLVRAMERDPRIVLPACERIEELLARNGRAFEGLRYRERAEQHRRLLRLAERERESVSSRDRFEPHGLPDTEIAALRAELARYEAVRRAYLVRKAVRYFPEIPFYVLVIVPVAGFLGFQSGRRDRDLLDRLCRADLPLPEGTYLLIAGAQGRDVSKALAKRGDALIFARS